MRFMEDPKASPHVKALLKSAESQSPLPPLYASLKRDFAGRDGSGAATLLLTGQRVRIVDVGKFGDFGATVNLAEPTRADVRVTLAEMSGYSDVP